MPRFSYVVEIKQRDVSASVLGTHVSVNKGHVWAADPLAAEQKVRKRFPKARCVEIMRPGSPIGDIDPEGGLPLAYLGIASFLAVVVVTVVVAIYAVISSAPAEPPPPPKKETPEYLEVDPEHYPSWDLRDNPTEDKESDY